MTAYKLKIIRFGLCCASDCAMSGYSVKSKVLQRGVDQIGVMTGYSLEILRFELRFVSDWFDEWL